MPSSIANFPSIVSDQDVWNFFVDADGLYVIAITARCKSWGQNLFKRRFGDDDLAVQMDDYLFGELKGKKREFNIIGSWNGNELKNASQTVFFLVPLKAGNHSVTFWTDISPFVESIGVTLLPFGAQQFTLPVPTGVSSVALVLKNITPTKIAVTNQSGVTSSIVIGPEGSLGVRVFELLKIGKPKIQSVFLEILNQSIVYKTGLVKLYRDITLLPNINLFSEPNSHSISLAAIIGETTLEILEERVIGENVGGKSNIWHKVRYHDTVGFVLSSFVEIQGQERQIIIDFITAMCNKYRIDIPTMLAIAGVESHYKPYAVAFDEYKREAQGVFQLQADAAKDVSVTDRFDFYQNIDGGVRYFKKIENNKDIKGYGNILKQRLLAWHNGMAAVISKNLKYSDFPPTSATGQFIINVLANIKNRDWKKIISVAVIFIALIINFTFWRSGYSIAENPAIEQVSDDQQRPDQEEIINNQKFKITDKSIILNSSRNGIKKIIVRELRDANNLPSTEIVYWSQWGEFKELLDSYLGDASWTGDFFYVARVGGTHYNPIAFFTVQNGLLNRVKFIQKNGVVLDDSESINFAPDQGWPTLRVLQSSNLNRNQTLLSKVYKDFRYDYSDNIFKEVREFKQVISVATGG